MLKICQMTGRGLANAAGQAVAMRMHAACVHYCVRGRSAVTKPAPPGPLCCILWVFSGVAPLRTGGKFTVKLLSGGSRHRSRVTFALTGGCIPVQPVSCHVRAPLRSRRCSTHHRPPQILPYLSELLHQAIPHCVYVAARRHALKQ